jgi:pyruvate kinase
MRISRYRPAMPVLALTPEEKVAGRLMLYWGVRPHFVGRLTAVDEGFEMAETVAKEVGVAKKGDLIIIAAGVPIGQAGTTNMLKVQKIA